MLLIGEGSLRPGAFPLDVNGEKSVVYRQFDKELIRLLSRDWVHCCEMEHYRGAMDYSAWLIAHYGPPMRRALTRERQRLATLDPARTRASALHTAYGRKSR